MNEKKKLPLATQIFIALILGIIAGLCLQSHVEFAEGYIKPIGTIFLNLLKFIVVPIVLFSIMSGIISMSDIKKVGSIGIKTLVYYLCTTAIAILIGLVGGNLFKQFFPILETSNLNYEAPGLPEGAASRNHLCLFQFLQCRNASDQYERLRKDGRR